MTKISVQMSKENAERFSQLLGDFTSQVNAADKKLLTGIQSVLGHQLQDLEEKMAQNKSAEEIEDFVIQMRDVVLEKLPKIRKAGLTKEVVSYISTVSQTHRKATDCLDAYEKENYPYSSGKTIPSDEFIKVLTPYLNKLRRAGDKLDEAGSTPLVASEDYTHADRRARDARKCLSTALDQAKGALSWEDLSMVSMSFNDMNTHVQLGVALLDGSPKKISAASNMDTACREEIDSKVWDFILDLDSGDVKGYGKVDTRKSKPKSPR